MTRNQEMALEAIASARAETIAVADGRFVIAAVDDFSPIRQDAHRLSLLGESIYTSSSAVEALGHCQRLNRRAAQTTELRFEVFASAAWKKQRLGKLELLSAMVRGVK